MDDKGYVKLHRKLLENVMVTKDSDHLSVWIYLLLNATHKEVSTLFKGKKIVLQSGELITGIMSIATKLKINKDKVQRILKSFEKDNQIKQQMSNKNRLITILNWNLYQNNDSKNDKQMINKCETNDKQMINKRNSNESDKQNVELNVEENPFVSKENYMSQKIIDKQNDKQMINNCETTDKQLINNCETTDKQLITNKNVKNERIYKPPIIPLREKYFENEKVNEVFEDFLGVRKKIKAVNSERAVKTLVKKLSRYSDETKLKMLENSIVNSWKDVYELKQEVKTKSKSKLPIWNDVDEI